MEYTIIPQIKAKYDCLIAHAESVGIESSLHIVIDDAVRNLIDKVNYKPKKTYISGEDIEHQFPRELYYEIKKLSKETGASYSSIINFSLDRYWLPYSTETKKKILDMTLNDDKVAKIVSSLLNTQELEIIDDGFIIFDCPICGTKGFYARFDCEKKKIYVRCTNDNCDYRIGGYDMINLLHTLNQMKYKDAINSMYDVLYNGWIFDAKKYDDEGINMGSSAGQDEHNQKPETIDSSGNNKDFDIDMCVERIRKSDLPYKTKINILKSLQPKTIHEKVVVKRAIELIEERIEDSKRDNCTVPDFLKDFEKSSVMELWL